MSAVEFRREVCAKGVTIGEEITDAKEIVQRRYFRIAKCSK